MKRMKDMASARKDEQKRNEITRVLSCDPDNQSAMLGGLNAARLGHLQYRKSVHKLQLRVHPDKNKGDRQRAHVAFQMVSAAAEHQMGAANAAKRTQKAAAAAEVRCARARARAVAKAAFVAALPASTAQIAPPVKHRSKDTHWWYSGRQLCF